MIFRDHALAHQFLDGLDGIEIGASAHNPFNLRGRCRNVDISCDMNTVFKQAEREMCGRAASVDIVAPGNCLPLKDGSVDYVVSSHVLEHFWDPVSALLEWDRMIRAGGFILAIVPHRNALE